MSRSADENGDKENGRAAQKRKEITVAAQTVFLRNGYVGTNLDEVVALAGVSKQTLYKYFDDKEGLFADIILNTIDTTYDAFAPAILSLAEADDLEKRLDEFACHFIDALMQPRVVQMRRLVIGEVNRFPELGARYYERTYQRTITLLTSVLSRHVERGLLYIDNPELAAHQFCWLVFAIPRNEVLLRGDHIHFLATELKEYAHQGVRTFLAAYGRPPGPPFLTAESQSGR